MKHIVSLIVALTVLLLALTSIATADVPNLMHYQGHLTDESGPLDTTLSMIFTIYDDSIGPNDIWTETQPSVTVTSGLFNVLLGSVSPIADSVFADTVRWLGIKVGDDAEISPRTKLVTVPYAFRVSTVDGAAGGAITGDLDASGNIHASGTISSGSSITIDGNANSIYSTSDRISFGNDTLFTTGSLIISTYAGLSSDHPIYVRELYNTSDARRGCHIDIDNAGTGHVTGLRAGAHSTTAGSGGSVVGVWAHGSSDGTSRKGIWATACAWDSTITTGTSYGVYGLASDGQSAYGLRGDASSATTGYGIYGKAYNNNTNWAGYFVGNVNVTGTLTKGGGGFKIDHPLDPENKYLYHSFVESPDMKNVYDGVVTLDAKGEAVVELPDYFEAVNRDFRYQLTAIGVPGPNLYVSEEISDNHFKIAGGESGMKVSWQVTGIRKDAFAEANRIQVEVDKPTKERGKYLHPEAYRLSEEYGIHYEQHKRMKEKLQEKSIRKMEQR